MFTIILQALGSQQILAKHGWILFIIGATMDMEPLQYMHRFLTTSQM
jgi:hypothetical protein